MYPLKAVAQILDVEDAERIASLADRALLTHLESARLTRSAVVVPRKSKGKCSCLEKLNFERFYCRIRH